MVSNGRDEYKIKITGKNRGEARIAVKGIDNIDTTIYASLTVHVFQKREIQSNFYYSSANFTATRQAIEDRTKYLYKSLVITPTLVNFTPMAVNIDLNGNNKFDFYVNSVPENGQMNYEYFKFINAIGALNASDILAFDFEIRKLYHIRETPNNTSILKVTGASVAELLNKPTLTLEDSSRRNPITFSLNGTPKRKNIFSFSLLLFKTNGEQIRVILYIYWHH